MIEYSQLIKDVDGHEIKVGTKVRYFDDPPGNPAHVGEVIEITDWDGDVDDDTGRSIMNPPDVKVKFPDSEVAEYRTSEWEFSEGGWRVGKDGDPEPGWNHAEGKCEELSVVK
jgi:hypothetical protein